LSTTHLNHQTIPTTYKPKQNEFWDPFVSPNTLLEDLLE
jgi:hypothetical protein